MSYQVPLGYVPIFSSALRPLGAAYIPILLSEVEQERWREIGRIFLVERTEVEPFDRNAWIEWNAVEFYRVCCMARSLRSIRQVATLRHGNMARRSASLRSCIQGTRCM